MRIVKNYHVLHDLICKIFIHDLKIIVCQILLQLKVKRLKQFVSTLFGNVILWLDNFEILRSPNSHIDKWLYRWNLRNRSKLRSAWGKSLSTYLSSLWFLFVSSISQFRSIMAWYKQSNTCPQWSSLCSWACTTSTPVLRNGLLLSPSIKEANLLWYQLTRWIMSIKLWFSSSKVTYLSCREI
jgi:hypothetical protein